MKTRKIRISYHRFFPYNDTDSTDEEEEEEKEENFEVFIVTKPFNKENSSNSWKKVPFQLIPSKSTPTKDHYICYINDFDDNSINKVKVGIVTINNYTTKDFVARYYMDGNLITCSSNGEALDNFVVPQGEYNFKNIINYNTKEVFPLILQKNIMVDNINEISEQDILDRIGTIKVVVNSGEFNYKMKTRSISTTDQSRSNYGTSTTKFKNITINENLLKHKQISVNLGDSKRTNENFSFNTPSKNPEFYKEYEFEYCTKLQYFFKLKEYGINNDLLLNEQPNSTLNNEPEVIVIEDEEDDNSITVKKEVIEDGLDIILNEKLNKISKKEFVKWNCGKVSKWINELEPQFTEKNIGGVLLENDIDGALFLGLTLDMMKNDLNLSSLGIRLKLQRIINYLKNQK
ncbi:hypothetical protein ABK040_000448 [Willaertia magna]